MTNWRDYLGNPIGVGARLMHGLGVYARVVQIGAMAITLIDDAYYVERHTPESFTKSRWYKVAEEVSSAKGWHDEMKKLRRLARVEEGTQWSRAST